MAPAGPLADAPAPATSFARDVVRGLATLGRDDLAGGKLTLVFAMSAWLRRQDTEIEAAIGAMLRLRLGLALAGGIDVATEPVPLLPADRRTALLNLGVYVHDLLHRAAASARTDPAGLADAVAEDLGAA